jgi:small basic protein (TIGR04137 family)
MSQHPSLKAGIKETKFRSVLKRFEKIKELSEGEKWSEEKDSVYKLPKVKRIMFKVKKQKGPAEEEGEEGVVAGAAPAAGAAKAPAAGAAKAPAAGAAKAPAAGKKK